jgi:hypothetical protein
LLLRLSAASLAEKQQITIVSSETSQITTSRLGDNNSICWQYNCIV